MLILLFGPFPVPSAIPMGFVFLSARTPAARLLLFFLRHETDALNSGLAALVDDLHHASESHGGIGLEKHRLVDLALAEAIAEDLHQVVLRNRGLGQVYAPLACQG